ncbi:TonB-dependent receptor [Pseudoalteromonas sp. Hal099]
MENEIDREFSGGEVDVWGVESQFSHTYALNKHIDVPVRLTYTYTQSEFKEELFSEFTQWGHIRPGDHLPYLPNHQAALSLGLAHNDWSVDVVNKIHLRNARGRWRSLYRWRAWQHHRE